MLEALAEVLREEFPQEGTIAGEAEAEETEELGAMDVEVVADRALVAQTRLGEGDRTQVEWVGRCWAWLIESEAPLLKDVVAARGASGRRAR